MHRSFAAVVVAGVAAEAFRKAKGRWPTDIAELFTANPTLAATALLLPGDSRGEPVLLPAGDPRTARSSFRYFLTPVPVTLQGSTSNMLLVGIAPRAWARPMLTDDGVVPDTYGEVCTRPIDRFGK